MPDPIIDPATIIVASNAPRPRMSSREVEGAAVSEGGLWDILERRFYPRRAFPAMEFPGARRSNVKQRKYKLGTDEETLIDEEVDDAIRATPS